MTLFRTLITAVSILVLSACYGISSGDGATVEHDPTVGHDPAKDLGILWVKHSAEYQAIATQVYRDATDDLPGFIEDKTWNVLTGYGDTSALPPAVILDVDETVVSNVNFQLTYERPFANHKLDTWAANTPAVPIPGVKSFVETARSLGVTVFFVTNRPCQTKAGTDDPCPQQQTTIDGIHEIGLATDAEHVMLAGEQADWDREKWSRREHIAETHRVIMLIGDDFSDFARCVRAKPYGSCTAAATRESRADALAEYREYWGNGWYILPNPMHGSWTSVE